MKLELIDFIKTAASQDHQKFMSRRNHDLYKDFAAYLGYTRYHTPSMRPDNHPKWQPFRWSINYAYMVKDVRVMSFSHMSANALKAVAIEKDLTFPNGWKFCDVIDELMSIRREFKFSSHLIPAEWQIITKYLINTLYSVVATYGKGDLGIHHINEKMGDMMARAVRKISETAIVLYAFSDEIIYFGDQVDIPTPGIHHEKHKKVIFTENCGVAYGDFETTLIPPLMLDMEGWEPSKTFPQSPEEQRERKERHIAQRIDRFKRSLEDYIKTRTKSEYQEEENYLGKVDCNSITL